MKPTLLLKYPNHDKMWHKIQELLLFAIFILLLISNNLDFAIEPRRIFPRVVINQSLIGPDPFNEKYSKNEKCTPFVK